ncbi:hypothetical protein D3C78_446100 [compost metagenome]
MQCLQSIKSLLNPGVANNPITGKIQISQLFKITGRKGHFGQTAATHVKFFKPGKLAYEIADLLDGGSITLQIQGSYFREGAVRQFGKLTQRQARPVEYRSFSRRAVAFECAVAPAGSQGICRQCTPHDLVRRSGQLQRALGPVIKLPVELMMLLAQCFDGVESRPCVLPLLDKLIEQSRGRGIDAFSKTLQLALAVIPDHFFQNNKVPGLTPEILIGLFEVWTRHVRPIQRQPGPEFFMPFENAIGECANGSPGEVQTFKTGQFQNPGWPLIHGRCNHFKLTQIA